MASFYSVVAIFLVVSASLLSSNAERVTRLWTKETSDRLQRIVRSAERHPHEGRAFLTSNEDINGDKPSPFPLINLLDHRQKKRASRMASQPVLRQEFVDATNFQRNTVYSSLDFLPHNLSVVLIRWYPQPSIRVSWLFNDKVPCEAFQILYHPVASRFRYIIEVPCNIRNITIERLLPSTEYILTVNTVPSVDVAFDPSSSTHGISGESGREASASVSAEGENRNSHPTPIDKANKQHHHDHHHRIFSNSIPPDGQHSYVVSGATGQEHTQKTTTVSGRKPYHGSAPNMIRFISPQVEYTGRFSKFKSNSLIIRRDPDFFDPDAGVVIVKKGELAVVLFVLSGWLLIIFIFIRKWGKIRGIETVSSFPGAVRGNISSSGIPFGSSNAVFPVASSSPQVGGGGGGGSGSVILKSQKSKESDESSAVDGGGSGHQNSPAPFPGLVSSSIKKKRLEDALHQFLVMKNQQAIASGHHYYYNHRGLGPYCDQFIVGRRVVRSQDTPRTTHFYTSIGRRGSLEDHAVKVHSESDLKLLRDPRMNRSAENLMAFDVVL